VVIHTFIILGVDMDDLTPYQRGNRDGLLALAKWADEMENLYKKDYEKISGNIEINSLTGLRYEMTARASLHKSITFREVARQARRLSEALPLDPEFETP
jgi:hypothetical protein